MNRNYIVVASIVVGGLAFGAIAAERQSLADRTRADADALVSAEQREQQQQWQRAHFAYTPITPTAAATRQEQAIEDEATGALKDDKRKVANQLAMKLEDAERKINDMQATARSATADSRTDCDRVLNDVSVRRDALRADAAAIDAATDDTWEALRTRIEVDEHALDGSLRIASSHINGPHRQALR